MRLATFWQKKKAGVFAPAFRVWFLEVRHEDIAIRVGSDFYVSDNVFALIFVRNLINARIKFRAVFVIIYEIF